MSARRRGSGPPKRRVGAVPVRPQVLVFTEGERTEPDYVQAWHRRFRGRVNVTLDRRHGTPLTIVRHAVRAKRDDAVKDHEISPGVITGIPHPEGGLSGRA